MVKSLVKGQWLEQKWVNNGNPRVLHIQTIYSLRAIIVKEQFYYF